MKKTGPSGEIEIVPAFFDVDPMGIVWHGNYVKYLELGRCALLERHGYGYLQMQASGYGWPVVDMRLKYARSARFGQRLVLRSEITEWEHRLRIDYVLRDAASGERLTRAWTIQLAVDLASGELQFVCPPVLQERLGIAP